ncbi:MAG: DNA ligase D, partial [Gammaproteobacteria bacterium]
MGLANYRKKRNFRATPEPSGKLTKKSAGNLFVIQKHAARRLHYDFRLELGGTLKSWAVPKGPSLDPGQKRLAVHVEDHPLAYANFEGIIPPHQYGSGTVMVWDTGTWEPIGNAATGYAAGKLKFRLHGEKLQGAWMLARMRDKANEGEDNWLLIKERDNEALSGRAAEIVESATSSVVSGRSLEQIAANTAPIKQTARSKKPPPIVEKIDPSRISGARKFSLPALLKPQLATLVKAAPSGAGWLHEIKYDGYRMLCRVRNGKAAFFSRTEKDWTQRFSALSKAVADLPVQEAWFDGEVVAVKPDGTTSFQALQQALDEEKSHVLIYYIFDVLHLNGYDLRQVPLIERKRIVASLLQHNNADDSVRYSDHVDSNGELFFGLACARPLEGIISKRQDAPYRAGRSYDWVKVKCISRQEFVIGGFTQPAGSRKGFGALLLGVYDKSGEFHYSGRVGTGFSDDLLISLHARLKKLVQKTPAFSKPPSGAAARGVRWVKPQLVAEINFTEWTDDGALRHPSFLGLREDKAAREVIRETEIVNIETNQPAEKTPRPRAKAASNKKIANTSSQTTGTKAHEVAGVILSHPDKVLYPDIGLTKSDLAHYYEAVAPLILPHLIDRPLTLLRCPDGSDGACFYQKHAKDIVSEHIGRITIQQTAGRACYMTADSLPAIISLVQMGVLELHTWGSRRDKLDRPDRITFDLDPDTDVKWIKVIEAANMIRDYLAALKLISFVKTTGGKGLHIVVPLVRRNNW